MALRMASHLGLFARWHYAERAAMRYEVPEDLWHYWALEVFSWAGSRMLKRDPSPGTLST